MDCVSIVVFVGFSAMTNEELAREAYAAYCNCMAFHGRSDRLPWNDLPEIFHKSWIACCLRAIDLHTERMQDIQKRFSEELASNPDLIDQIISFVKDKAKSDE